MDSYVDMSSFYDILVKQLYFICIKSGAEGGVGGARVSSHFIDLNIEYSHVNVNLSIYTLIQQSNMPNTLIERPNNSACILQCLVQKSCRCTYTLLYHYYKLAIATLLWYLTICILNSSIKSPFTHQHSQYKCL